MAAEDEEFEFRARAEKEGQRRSPKFMSQSDDPSKVGIFNAMQSVDKAIYDVGGKVSDTASRMGASPEVAGGAGYLTHVGLNMLPLGPLGKAGKMASIPLQKLGQWSSKELMGSALKPTPTQWKSGEGATAVKTMLEKGLNVTEGSVVKLKTELEGLQKQVSDAISKSGETVKKSDVVKTIQDAMKHFKGGTGEIQDMNVIKDVIKEFVKAPSVKGLTEIPVQVAQRMKQLEYRRIDKAYGVLGDAEETARKGTARGLKEGIEKAHPEVAGWNASEQEIYKTLPVLERRAMMEINKHPAGLALLAHDNVRAAAMMLDKSSLFKSWLANRLKELGGGLPTIGQGVGQASAIPLSQVGQQ